MNLISRLLSVFQKMLQTEEQRELGTVCTLEDKDIHHVSYFEKKSSMVLNL